MYSSFKIAKKYLHYFITAKNGKGHGIHSPFVFDFIIHVLNDRTNHDCYNTIEPLRQQLLNSNSVIDVKDFGAGSASGKTKKRKISSIANSSLKNKKFGQLLFRMVNYYQPETIIELGTSLGITTSYLACGHKNAKVDTFEGSEEISKIASQNFAKLCLKNICLTEGNFDETFFKKLAMLNKVDLAFIDGNHRKIPTLNYFNALIKKTTGSSILVFDDIHWSADMEEAWKQIQTHPSVALTIDLFFIGVVFFNPDFKVKQHFTIRF